MCDFDQLYYNFTIHYKLIITKININYSIIGRGSGSFGGGLLIASLGTREAFRYMGLIAFLGGILYGLLHYFWLRKINMKSIRSVSDNDTGKCIYLMNILFITQENIIK